MMVTTKPPLNRRVQFAYQAFVILGVLAILGLVVDMALLLANYRIGQAALDGAALAAANAVKVTDVNGGAVIELRLEETSDGRPSAYTLAQQYIETNGQNRVILVDVVSDGGHVLVRGSVTSPMLFARLFGVPEIDIPLISSAELNPARRTPLP